MVRLVSLLFPFLHRFLRSALRVVRGLVLFDQVPQQRIQIRRHEGPLPGPFLRLQAAFLAS